VSLKKILCTALLAISLILSACTAGSQAEGTPTPDAQAVLTAAAQTAQARMTDLAAVTPSPLPATPTLAPVTPSATVTLSAQTGVVPTTAAPPVASGGTDRVEFVADLTVPDGTVYKPGEKFTKTWRLLNAGTSTWTLGYALVFASGEQMGGVSATNLTVEVAPGKTVDLSVGLTAPDNEGKHTGYWQLRNAAGTNFGMGPKSDGLFYVEINVSAAAVTRTPGTGTPAAATSTSSSTGGVVTNTSLTVDTATVEASCPYTFAFTAGFILSRAANVTYRLEVDASYAVNLPGPTTASLNAGTSTVTYTLEFTDSVTGTARLHITSPEDVRSDPVSFSLTCQ